MRRGKQREYYFQCTVSGNEVRERERGKIGKVIANMAGNGVYRN